MVEQMSERGLRRSGAAPHAEAPENRRIFKRL